MLFKDLYFDLDDHVDFTLNSFEFDYISNVIHDSSGEFSLMFRECNSEFDCHGELDFVLNIVNNSTSNDELIAPSFGSIFDEHAPDHVDFILRLYSMDLMRSTRPFPSIEEPLQLELKPLSTQLKYAYLEYHEKRNTLINPYYA